MHNFVILTGTLSKLNNIITCYTSHELIQFHQDCCTQTAFDFIFSHSKNSHFIDFIYLCILFSFIFITYIEFSHIYHFTFVFFLPVFFVCMCVCLCRCPCVSVCRCICKYLPPSCFGHIISF